jgi:hypothetical protein
MKHGVAIGLLLAALTNQGTLAAPCVVVGDKSARIQTSEGEKSPVFLTQSCASLKLLSGTAMVTWIDKDGKPNFVPIGSDGPQRLPASAADEHTGSLVWSEITSRRETKRSAVMRSVDDGKAERVYIPAEGLSLRSKSDGALRIFSWVDQTRTLVFEAIDPSTMLLTRAVIQPGARYVVEWNQDGKTERWQWLALTPQEHARIDAQMGEIAAMLPDEVQRKVVNAMLFEQMRLPVNRKFVLAPIAANADLNEILR